MIFLKRHFILGFLTATAIIFACKRREFNTSEVANANTDVTYTKCVSPTEGSGNFAGMVVKKLSIKGGHMSLENANANPYVGNFEGPYVSYTTNFQRAEKVKRMSAGTFFVSVVEVAGVPGQVKLSI